MIPMGQSKLITEKSYLDNYSLQDYDRPSIATDIAAFSLRTQEGDQYRLAPEHKLCVLLIKRGEHPFRDCWALPGGFLKRDETVEACAFRELKEETNLEPASMVWVNTFSQPDRDPRGWIISHSFASISCEEDAAIVGATDASDAKWFDVSLTAIDSQKFCLQLSCDDIHLSAELSAYRSEIGKTRFQIAQNNGLSFDHAAIIAEAMETLKKEAENIETVFAFLPEKFTLLMLQRVQETLMGITLLTANFRRKIASYVEETEEFTEGVGHRPARLFRRK